MQDKYSVKTYMECKSPCFASEARSRDLAKACNSLNIYGFVKGGDRKTKIGEMNLGSMRM
jgi:hypothetical protein